VNLKSILEANKDLFGHALRIFINLDSIKKDFYKLMCHLMLFKLLILKYLIFSIMIFVKELYKI